MNGPRHYAEAERLLNMMPSHGVNCETGLDRAETIAAAQVHATLALVMATAEGRIHTPQQPWGGTETLPENATAWAEACS